MLTLRIAPRAQRQIDTLLRHSETTFGAHAAGRYRLLLLAAFDTLAKDPMQASRMQAPVQRETWLYHLRHARTLVPLMNRVASPRHFVAYRVTQTHLEVVQVLDDRMDLPARFR